MVEIREITYAITEDNDGNVTLDEVVTIITIVVS